MVHIETEAYTEINKREAQMRQSQRSHPGKKMTVDAKICKHVAAGGWCNKKHQRCPLLNLLFINQ
jgi:hypothetical protein